MARKFGLHLRYARPGWRRWRPDWRRREFWFFFRRFYGRRFAFEFDPLQEFLPPPFPEEEFVPGPGAPIPPPVVLPGGLGCPQVLSQIGWVGQDVQGIISLAQLGVQIPPVGQIAFSGGEGIIYVVRTRGVGAWDAKLCDFPGSLQDAEEVAASWNTLSQAELGGLGFS